MSEKGHWKTQFEFDQNDWFGFIYLITCHETGHRYIGKKQFFNTNRVKVKNRKNRKKVIKESNWKTYTSSSAHLNAAIEEYGIEKFSFEILSLHKTKASLYYREVEVQIKLDCIRDPMWLNRQAGAVKFVPPQPLKEEIEHSVDVSQLVEVE
jgi:hypothetical protein